MNNLDKTQPKLSIALLAAGQASRFGSPKQLACYQGQTLIERAIALLEGVNCELSIITGAHHSDIYQHLTSISKEDHVVFNQDWQQGMSSSIKAAVRHCPEDCSGVMFITVDQIQLTQADIQSLIDLWRQESSRIVCAEYAGHRGVPAIFPRQYFSQLLDLDDDKGARNLIKSSPNVSTVLLPNAELDIDTVAQLNELNNFHTPKKNKNI
ncbi:nucleotidyltransferase family protein [uncultured Psychrosphaera sp.]|uniref:nucleotidyltransferase family protein n=1 Tax=uncultured Psychrosphaera sp. TaxID=1403522 RepID=UPI0030F51070